MSLSIETVEMHTGGEPVRLVVAGYPAIPGADILAKHGADPTLGRPCQAQNKCR